MYNILQVSVLFIKLGGTYVIGRQFDVSLSLFGYKYQTINLSLYLHASQAPITVSSEYILYIA